MASPLHKEAIERMAQAAAIYALPKSGEFNSDQMDAMKGQIIDNYRAIAEVMMKALLSLNRELLESKD